jgi:hypothetical protein
LLSLIGRADRIEPRPTRRLRCRDLTPSLDALDLLPHLQLAARQLGIELEFRRLSEALCDLITYFGQ